jgi:hypothetical protein
MSTKRPDRSRRPDLLHRPPAGSDRRSRMELTVDPVAQMHALADLHGRGLLGPEEFELCQEMLLNAYR